MKALLIVIVALAACVVRSEDAAKQPTPTTGTPVPGYSIANCVQPFDAQHIQKTSVGYQFWFADSKLADGKTVKLSVVGPHLATHPPHRHVEDEFFFVVEGTAEFFLDGETKRGGPMTLFYCPSWHEHGIRNVGDTELKYLVIKKYQGAVPTATEVKQVPGAALPPTAASAGR